MNYLTALFNLIGLEVTISFILFIGIIIVTALSVQFIETKFSDKFLINKELIEGAAGPIYWMFGSIFILILIPEISKLAKIQNVFILQILGYIPLIKSFLIILCVSSSLVRFVNVFQKNYINYKKTSGAQFDIQKIDMIHKISMVTILVFASIFVMNALGIDLRVLAAAGGLGGIIFGLSAKDLLSNFFGLFSIYFDKPFVIGDEITILDKKINGIVEEIKLRTTSIRIVDTRTLIYVPNSIFNTSIIENNTRLSNRIFLYKFTFKFDKFLISNEIYDLIQKILNNLDFIDKTNDTIMKIISLDNQEIEISFKIFFKPMRSKDFVDSSNIVIKMLFEEFEKLNLKVINTRYPDFFIKNT
jgi:small-conductance mechanosensitive channel